MGSSLKMNEQRRLVARSEDASGERVSQPLSLEDFFGREARTLVLVDILDYSSEEAEKTLGITAGSVRGLASRAREILRRQVGERA